MRKEALRQRDAMSDEELLGVCRAGDAEAFAALWERHRKAGLTAARSIAPTLDSEDLVSDSYLRIFELVRRGRGPTGAFRPYLYQVIRSAAADRFRSGEQASVELPDIPDLHEAAPWEDNAFDLNAVSEAFATLGPRWQAVLWYTDVEGMPPREAAKLLGLSANSTSVLAGRARDALKSAWVEAHVNREIADGACRFTLEHLQRFQRDKLTAKLTRQVEAHLEECESCSRAAAEYSTLNRQLGLVLAWVSLGGAGAAALASQLGLATQLGASGVGAAATAAAAGHGGAAGGAASGAAGGGTATGTTSAAFASGLSSVVGSIGIPAAVGGASLLAAAAVGVGVAAFALPSVLQPAPEPVPQSEVGTVSTVADAGRPDVTAGSTASGSKPAPAAEAAANPGTSLPAVPPAEAEPGMPGEALPEVVGEPGSSPVSPPAPGPAEPIPAVPPVTKPPVTVPPEVDPPEVDPPEVDPPEVDPPEVDPPEVDPPEVDPPEVDPPEVDPPEVDPPEVDPPEVDPPEVDPPGTECPTSWWHPCNWPPITWPPHAKPGIDVSALPAETHGAVEAG